MTHFADRLAAAMESTRSLACVGLDPVIDKLPAPCREGRTDPDAIYEFSRGVLQAITGKVPAVKFQSACYERHGPAALVHLQSLIAQAKAQGLIVILDAKRGDIGITAEHYASAAFHTFGADALTVSPYLGLDTLEPYAKVGGPSTGLFVLVRTSNPGSDIVQNLLVTHQGDKPSVQTLAHVLGGMVSVIGRKSLGSNGLSSIGAVVGATKSADAAALRDVMPDQIFLIPGYGTQGGTASDIVPMLRTSRSGGIAESGVLVTASRSVIYPDQSRLEGSWEQNIASAATRLNRELAQVLK